METGKFYFIKNEYYEKFPNCGLMGNKEEEDHKRPCFYCFENEGYYWMIPISSQVPKYRKIYNEKIARYKGNYDGIRFGYVNGQERAFLIQNICPVIDEYIESKYMIEHNTVDVSVNLDLAKELNALARKVIRLHKNGTRITLTDLTTILSGLNPM